ncbi:hypothetical protein C8R42DRAFT_641861 [Lentinula raphanica]|nr:hypothetical protein C8R42DRAFT_641861 [Lentinula raphanica]
MNMKEVQKEGSARSWIQQAKRLEYWPVGRQVKERGCYETLSLAREEHFEMMDGAGGETLLAEAYRMPKGARWKVRKEVTLVVMRWKHTVGREQEQGYSEKTLTLANEEPLGMIDGVGGDDVVPDEVEMDAVIVETYRAPNKEDTGRPPPLEFGDGLMPTGTYGSKEGILLTSPDFEGGY